MSIYEYTVRFGSFGDIESRTDYGSFTPKSDGKSGHPEEAHFPDQAAR